MSTHLHILITGGTIDSVFDAARDSVVVNNATTITHYIEQMIRPHFTVSQEIVTLRDSRDISDNGRAELASSIEKYPYECILVTHGTYTMAQTATYLAKHVKHTSKKVILTGSMFPIQGFTPTDAPFNIGFAIGSLFLAKPGVYLAVNGRLFPAGTAVKNTAAGRFEIA